MKIYIIKRDKIKRDIIKNKYIKNVLLVLMKLFVYNINY